MAPQDTVTTEKLQKAFSLTREALEKVKNSPQDPTRKKETEDFFDMANRYYQDAQHFHKKENLVLAYGALHYAHAWLDAGARIGLFKVKDSRLFTV